MEEGPLQGKGIKEIIGRVFFVGLIVSGLIRWGGGVGRFCFYLFVLLREILVRDMGFVQ